jgi:hypothetical protein
LFFGEDFIEPLMARIREKETGIPAFPITIHLAGRFLKDETAESQRSQRKSLT